MFKNLIKYTNNILTMPLGFHVSKTYNSFVKQDEKKPSIVNSLKLAQKKLNDYDFTDIVLQMYVIGPQNSHECTTKEEREQIRTMINKNFNIIIHGAYINNPWNLDESIRIIKREMTIAYDIKAKGIIVHLGPKASDFDRLKEVIHKIAKNKEDVVRNIILYFETNAAKPQKCFETPKKLYDFVKNMHKINETLKYKLRFGLCIDTAHLYSCGISLADHDTTNNWLNEFTEKIKNIPVMFHLNDSASQLGSGKDKHAPLTKGNIWRQYNLTDGVLNIIDSGLICLLKYAHQYHCDVILERDKSNIDSDLTLIDRIGYLKK